MTNQQRTNKATISKRRKDWQGSGKQNKLQNFIVVGSLKGLVVRSPHTVLLFVPQEDKMEKVAPKDGVKTR